MRLARIAFVVVVLLLSALVWPNRPAGAADAGVFHPQSFTLENGLRVVLVSNHRAPIVVHMIWYGVGAADEPAGKSGLAHVLEHLMFKGTETLGPGEFSRIVSRNGGQDNAFTSQDYTGYYQMVASDRLELVMGMEADRMTHLVLEADRVEPERKVILEERRLRVENDPSSVLAEHMDAALYLNHPYRLPVIGWKHEIEALTLDDILSFYRHWYAPNNAVVVVAGDVTLETLRPMAQRIYGSIPPVAGLDVGHRGRPQEPPQNAARRLVLEDERVGVESWSRVFLAPTYGTGATEHAYPLEVLADIVGGGASSRLYRSMVVDRKLAVSAGAYYAPDDMGPTAFGFYASPAEGVSMDTLETAMAEEIDSLVTRGVTEEEVERTRTRLRRAAVFARDALRTGVEVLGQAIITGRSIEDVEAWPNRIAMVTRDQVNAAAAAVLVPEQSVTALLLRKARPTPPAVAGEGAPRSEGAGG